MERRSFENKPIGIKKTAQAAVLAVFLASCGNNNATETPKPTILSTESPTPTILVSIAPTETPVATLSPTPKITPKPIDTIISAEHPTVKITTVISSVEKAYENNKSVILNKTLTQMKQSLQECQFGIPGDPPQAISQDKSQGCAQAVFILYDSYKKTGDNNFYNAALDTYNYSVNALPVDYKAYLDGVLKNSF